MSLGHEDDRVNHLGQRKVLARMERQLLPVHLELAVALSIVMESGPDFIRFTGPTISYS